MSRRYKVGDEFLFDGMRYRIALGDKPVRGGPRKGELGHDLVLEWYLQDEFKWVRPTFKSLALMVAFLCENEDVLYPPSAGLRGGGYLTEFLELARHGGHEAAIAELTEDKANRRRRDAA